MLERGKIRGLGCQKVAALTRFAVFDGQEEALQQHAVGKGGVDASECRYVAIGLPAGTRHDQE